MKLILRVLLTLCVGSNLVAGRLRHASSVKPTKASQSLLAKSNAAPAVIAAAPVAKALNAAAAAMSRSATAAPPPAVATPTVAAATAPVVPAAPAAPVPPAATVTPAVPAMVAAPVAAAALAPVVVPEVSAPAVATPAAHVPVAAAPSKGRVLFVVYSDSKFYETRLKWVTNTWARDVPQESLVIIGDAPYTGAGQVRARKVVATQCPAHSHWEGACCKYAEAVIHALEIMREDPSYEWAYFTDDDAYVRHASIENALMQQQEPSGRGLLLSNIGCATKQCTGICAGGGYAANRRAIVDVVEGAIGANQPGANASQAFLTEQMQSCSQCERWADVALAQLYKRRGVELRPLEGLYGWRLPKDKFEASLTNAVEPLMYHYIQSEQQMQFLDGLFGNNTRQVAQTAPSTTQVVGAIHQPQTAWCSNFHGEHACGQEGVAASVPWGPMLIQNGTTTYSRWRPMPRTAAPMRRSKLAD